MRRSLLVTAGVAVLALALLRLPGGAAAPARDEDALPSGPVLYVEGIPALEGNSGISRLPFRFLLSHPPREPVVVELVVVGGTAKAGEDYEPLRKDGGPTRFEIDEGSVLGELFMGIFGDTRAEQDETVKLGIVSARTTSGKRVKVATPRVTGTMLDDDGESTLHLVSYWGGELGSDVSFSVLLAGHARGKVTYRVRSSGGTAKPGEDFTGGLERPFVGRFAPGAVPELSVATADVVDDAKRERSETIVFVLDSVKGAKVGKATAVGLILDND